MPLATINLATLGCSLCRNGCCVDIIAMGLAEKTLQVCTLQSWKLNFCLSLESFSVLQTTLECNLEGIGCSSGIVFIGLAEKMLQVCT